MPPSLLEFGGDERLILDFVNGIITYSKKVYSFVVAPLLRRCCASAQSSQDY